MMDWDSDPELKKIRDEFIESLQERRTLLANELSVMVREGEASRATCEAVQGIAHKIAGTAASYGFPALTRAGELIDDLLDLSLCENSEVELPSAEKVVSLAKMLDAFLESALTTRKDDPSLLKSDRFAALISGVESVLSATKS